MQFDGGTFPLSWNISLSLDFIEKHANSASLSFHLSCSSSKQRQLCVLSLEIDFPKTFFIAALFGSATPQVAHIFFVWLTLGSRLRATYKQSAFALLPAKRLLVALLSAAHRKRFDVNLWLIGVDCRWLRWESFSELDNSFALEIR